MKTVAVALVAAVSLILAGVGAAPVLEATVGPQAAIELPPYVATFSILGYDPDTGMVGGAVQSRVFSVGNGVLWLRHDSVLM